MPPRPRSVERAAPRVARRSRRGPVTPSPRRSPSWPTGPAGVVALRDGLYAACQAYANGVLGQDAYSLILEPVRNSPPSSDSSAPRPLRMRAAEPAASTSTPTAGAPSSTLVNVTTSGAGAAAQPSASAAKASTASASPADDPMAQARAQAVGALIVACITEGDLTQLRGPTQNTVLRAACPG